jgi:ribosomal protein L37AE/L43A
MKNYTCTKCGKEIRVKSVTEFLSDLKLCSQCHTKQIMQAYDEAKIAEEV